MNEPRLEPSSTIFVAGHRGLIGSAVVRRLRSDGFDAVVVRDHQALELADAGHLGVGRDYSIRELAGAIAGIVGYEGRIEWDASKPDGAPRKLLDSSRLFSLGWRPGIEFTDGLRSTYDWYRNTETSNHGR